MRMKRFPLNNVTMQKLLEEHFTMSIDLAEIIKKQQSLIKKKDEEIEQLKKNKKVAQNERYTFTKETVKHMSKKNGELNEKLIAHKSLLVELYLIMTDAPFSIKAMLRKVSDIEYVTPEVKNIAYKIRGEK